MFDNIFSLTPEKYDIIFHEYINGFFTQKQMCDKYEIGHSTFTSKFKLWKLDNRNVKKIKICNKKHPEQIRLIKDVVFDDKKDKLDVDEYLNLPKGTIHNKNLFEKIKENKKKGKYTENDFKPENFMSVYKPIGKL